MLKGIHIADLAGLADKSEVRGVFAVSNTERKTARNGDYWAMRLSDATGDTQGRLWSQFGRLEPEELPGQFMGEVAGSVSTFRDEKQIRVDTIRPLSEEEAAALDPADFTRSNPGRDSQFTELLALARSELSAPCWRRLVLGFLEDEDNAAAFRRASAAMFMHHAEVGGLVEHTLEVARLCLAACDIFPSLDRQLLLAGAIFHDIGKLREMSTGLYGTTYTSDGSLIGHLVLGVQILERPCEEAGLPVPLRRHLFHLLLSHHGLPEYGAVKEPLTPEALVLHHADVLSSHINTQTRLLAKARPETEVRRGSTSCFRATRTADLSGPDVTGGQPGAGADASARTPAKAPADKAGRKKRARDSASEAEPSPGAAVPAPAASRSAAAPSPEAAGPALASDAGPVPLWETAAASAAGEHWGMDAIPDDENLEEPVPMEEVPSWVLDMAAALPLDESFTGEGYDSVPDEEPEDAVEPPAGAAPVPARERDGADDALPPFMLDNSDPAVTARQAAPAAEALPGTAPAPTPQASLEAPDDEPPSFTRAEVNAAAARPPAADAPPSITAPSSETATDQPAPGATAAGDAERAADAGAPSRDGTPRRKKRQRSLFDI